MARSLKLSTAQRRWVGILALFGLVDSLGSPSPQSYSNHYEERDIDCAMDDGCPSEPKNGDSEPK